GDDRFDLIELKRELADLISYRPGVPAFLDLLGGMQKKRVLVTNAHPDSVALKFEHVDLGHRLDAIYNAHDLGEPKESLCFWQKLAGRLDFQPQRTLLIDDNLQALAAAEQFGIAYLRAVAQPNSQQGPVETAPYAALSRFVVR
ncbi:MAG TPA: haloacid dehalogenase, partial [Halothiobacillaceae bacterium]|nr:haloacid dehalogenase [Halothiobacillaceae bacterium]